MALPPDSLHGVSRRRFLMNMGTAPILFRASSLRAVATIFSMPETISASQEPGFSLAEERFVPHYPVKSPLEAVLRLVAPGTDEYVEEKYAYEIETLFKHWEMAFKTSDYATIGPFLDEPGTFSSLKPTKETALRSGAIESSKIEYAELHAPIGQKQFLLDLYEWIGHDALVERANFEVITLEAIGKEPLIARATIRYDIVANLKGVTHEQRVGTWTTEWTCAENADHANRWKMRLLQAGTETRSVAPHAVFVDVTEPALGHISSYKEQLLHGSDYWRTTLDAASGIDVYGNNGVAAGDFDNDGLDDLYVSQPAGLPNRLYRNRGDGTFEDVTESAGVGVLDNTSCALFADFRNCGLQDLLVVCGSGPLLFINQGNSTFKIKRDAFRFERTPEGTFTHAAISDYDRDGRLDVYFCVYSYYLGLDQYHYPVPYFDARNGPPNFLLHNEGDGTFLDRTDAAGLNAENDRYSFACAWNESPLNHMPDLYVVNDFGRNNLYRNNGDGTFTATSKESHVEDVGAGMSACWADIDNDGLADLYVANMWSAAGQRISRQDRFHKRSSTIDRDLYRRHAQGNALYENQNNGSFHNISQQADVEVGRWAWCSDSWDFDHDGYADLYVTNGYISAFNLKEKPIDLGSFFWRQVVAKSPDDATSSLAYEHGWNAINELIRSDSSWSGYERNVMFANNRDGTFSEVSAVVGLDLLEDGRSFALADIDRDGRLEVVVKNRNGPQLRVFLNVMQEIGDSIAFRLRGTKSNRDGIGTSINVQTGDLNQTKSLQAGSGFLAQHSKEVFFGLGRSQSAVNVIVRWPSGLTQHFKGLPRNGRILLEEGVSTFTATSFAKTTALHEPPTTLVKSAMQNPPSEAIETWLLDPLRAPTFSLPDRAGSVHHLQSFQGNVALLSFWATTSPRSKDQLKSFHQQQGAVDAAHLKIVAINIDEPTHVPAAHLYSEQQGFSFPVLFATEEVAGIYNIIYRHLFNRRRDLAIPTSFLLDQTGMIVKVFQGPFSIHRLLEDARSIPVTPAERTRKALPFAGTLYHGEFMRNDYTYGVAMFQHGYLEQAEESFKQVVAAKPNDAEAHYNLGTLNLRKNNFQQARTYLEQTLKLRPNYPEAWNNLGMMAAQQGHADDAIANFKQSLQQRPGYATALLNLGNVYRRQGAVEEAKDCLTRALDLQPDDPEANYSLGMFYAQQNQLQLAEDYLQKAIALRPDYAEALNNLGVISVRKQDYATAEQQFRTCIRIVPGFDQSYLNLARVYVAEHDKAKANEVLSELLRLRPESAAGKQGLQMLESTP